MKTDPTTSISGAAGMPLGYESVQSGRNSATNAKRKEAISDTLETTDREGNGRQTLDMPLNSAHPDADETTVTDRLDLTG